MDQYPSTKSLDLDSALSFVPETLCTLLNGLFVGKETSRKVAGFLVDTLNGMGFASSYREVLHFEKNAADSVAQDMLADDIDVLDMALLFAGDNVDHSILTTDGKGTYIAAITPG
ncbi:hypothetical protein ABG768_009595 [Culter alburnus]|uniref:Uncharacterized protein n=1 Tax=Culter alburnus TaxID=194366 RepID=A0AAW1ZHG3_CULAL